MTNNAPTDSSNPANANRQNNQGLSADIGPNLDRRQHFKLVNQETAFQGFFRVEQVSVQHKKFAGGWSSTYSRELFRRGAAACVLLYDPQLDKLALVEQFRVGAIDEPNPWLLELVAGIQEPGESLDALVRREAIEEANCTILDLLPICNYFASPGGSDERISLFCGRIDSQSAGGIHGLEEENEDIRVHVLDFEQAWQMLQNGQINNAATLIALQWLWINKSQVLDRWRPAPQD